MKIADLDIDDKKRSAPKERIPMIEDLFKLVLNRKPSTRELSFYKYGVQEKEEIVEKLLKDKEHVELLKKAKQAPKLDDKAKQAEHKVAQLTQRIEDTQEEIDQLKNLLDEKNKEIAILRREKNDPYNFTHSEALRYIKSLTENTRSDVNIESQNSTSGTHFSSITATSNYEKKTFIDKFYEFIKSI